MNKQQKKEHLAALCFCRSYLYLGGMINEVTNRKIHEKIKKYQDRYKIEITVDEMAKAEVIYKQ